MKPPRLLAATLLALLRGCTASDEESLAGLHIGTTNPLAKAIQMITDLQGKVIADGARDQRTYDDYVRWCGKSALEKQHEIRDGTSLKEAAQAQIEKAVSDGQDATSAIGELSGSIAADEADLKAATLLREKENQDFEALDRELQETIDTLNRARRVLEKELQKQGAFLQAPTKGMRVFQSTLNELVRAATIISVGDPVKQAALLQAQARLADALEASGSESDGEASENSPQKPTSRGILEALEDLQDKTEASQSEARNKETSSRHNFESLRQSLQGKLDVQIKELDDSKKQLARAQEVKAQAQKTLDECVKNLEGSQKMLAKLQNDCLNRAADFSKEVQDRKGQLDALAVAKKSIYDAAVVVSSDAMGLIQGSPKYEQTHRQQQQQDQDSQGYSFLQVRGGGGVNPTEAAVVVRQLSALAHNTGSVALTQLAAKAQTTLRTLITHQSQGLAISRDPFSKVRRIIEGMLSKLEREAKAEAGQKEFCDREMAHTKTTRTEKQDVATELTTRLETSAAEVAKLQEEIKTLSAEMADAAKNQAEMDRIRREDHEANMKAKADYSGGLEGVQVAIKALRDYYGRGASSSLVQEDISERMVAASDASAQQETVQQDGTKSDPKGAGSGIIALLEVVESDFAKALTEAVTREEASKDEYEKITAENKIAKAVQQKETQHKEEEVTRLRKLAAQLTSDRNEVTSELDAIQEYWDKLKPQCIQQPESAGERAKRRQAEIEGLKEALETLSGAKL